MIRFFSAILSLYAFVLILWGLSASFKYNVLGFDLESIPATSSMRRSSSPFSARSAPISSAAS